MPVVPQADRAANNPDGSARAALGSAPSPTESSPPDVGNHEPASTEVLDLGQLVVRFQAQVWRYLRLLGADTHEADDLMQETFVCVAGRQKLGDPVLAPAAYLRGIARNLLLGARRRDRRRPPTVSWLQAVDEFVTQQPDAIENGRIDALRRCVARLQGRARQAVQWHHLDGVPREEVAVRLGLGGNGLKSLLRRAREALRECVHRTERKERSS